MVLDVIILGAALHADPHTRDFNPGLGVELEIAHDRGYGQEVTIYAGAAVYRDSYVHQAEVGGLGFRIDLLGEADRLHAGGDVLAGYGHMTTWTGPVIEPSVYVGYGALNAHAALMSVDTLGFYLRYQVVFP